MGNSNTNTTNAPYRGKREYIMKRINSNKAKILLLFTRDPRVKICNKELEYYASDDDTLLGFVSQDNIDKTFHSFLFDRDTQNKYCLVDMELDSDTIKEARLELEEMMKSYVRDSASLQRKEPANDFFLPKVSSKQQNPYFKMLNDKDGFLCAAKKVIEEISYHFVDRDGNFVDQLQSKNGLDARIWELYLWCYLREEDFNFNYDNDAPDFMIEKWGQEVAIEAVHVSRKQEPEESAQTISFEEIKKKLENDIPLLFGSPLYSKLKHTYNNQPYWDLPHVKGKPLVYAIADFHADMSMTWSFPGIISILYGIEQEALKNEDGTINLQNESGAVFKKKDTNISPLFLDHQFCHVSAVLFSPCGTLSKFNRMGVQAGYGNDIYTIYQVKMCYNSSHNAIYPDIIGNTIDETCSESWADGIQIFHNPFAEIPLNPKLFPHAGHHFYKDGVLYSDTPDNQIISTTTYNFKNLPIAPPSFKLHSNEVFKSMTKIWRM